MKKAEKAEKAEKDNVHIKRLMESNEPFFIGRIAGVELKIAYDYLKHHGNYQVQDQMELENNAGIHVTSKQSLDDYAKALLESYDACTLIAEWEIDGKVFALTGMGQKVVEERTPTIPKINALALEPYYFKESWMSSLVNKRILIIHPFVQTIQKQISQLSKLFMGRDWFKGCTFQVISPPVTLAGNHKGRDWKVDYEECLERIRKVDDFDIALVAAGGYGMLLSNFIYKEKKRSVMYIGGALQLFFGIIGKRWFDNKEIIGWVNDDWVRPMSSEKPTNFVRVEKGCYW
jgi:hypothetical protein